MPEQTPTVGMERKLAAIFSTDVAGYSRLMGDDEAATIRILSAYREAMSTLIQRHRGRVVLPLTTVNLALNPIAVQTAP